MNSTHTKITLCVQHHLDVECVHVQTHVTHNSLDCNNMWIVLSLDISLYYRQAYEYDLTSVEAFGFKVRTYVYNLKSTFF